MSFASAGDFLSSVTRKLKLSTEAQASFICRKATEVLVQRFGVLGAQASQFAGKKITIAVPSTADASALYMKQNEILQAIQQACPQASVDEISIRVVLGRNR